MPLNWRSSRTTWVKAAAWDLAESARGAKSAMATRGLLTSIPIEVRNQSWPTAGLAKGAREIKIEIEPTRLNFKSTFTSGKLPSC
jgi:hypothetical protein